MNTNNAYYKFTSSPSRFSPRLAARVEGQADKFRSQTLCLLGDPQTFNPLLPSIGVVGTRRPTPYGIRFVSELMAALRGLEVQIISGGAMGIDAAAHAGALKNGLKTQAWLVGPLMRPSPKCNWPLFQDIVKSSGSALVVPDNLEPEIGTNPKKYQWVERNWWLVGACDALVVVEANMKSGTYASVKAASELGIPTFLLPGSIYSEKSAGINEMILMGCGHPIVSVGSLVKSLIEEILNSPYNNKWEAQKNQVSLPDSGQIEFKFVKFLADIDCVGVGLEEGELFERALALGWSWWETTENLSLLLERGILARAGSLIERRSL